MMDEVIVLDASVVR